MKKIGISFCRISIFAASFVFAAHPRAAFSQDETLLYQPSVDSLQDWNRVQELRDIILKTQTAIANAERILTDKRYNMKVLEQLQAKGACSRQEFLEGVWEKEDAELTIDQLKAQLRSEELHQQISLKQMAWSQEGKPEVVAQIAGFYTEQWQNRIDLARIMERKLRSEYSYREFHYEVLRKLAAKGATSRTDLMDAATRIDNVSRDIVLHQERRLHAEKAYQEAVQHQKKVTDQLKATVPAP